MSNSDSFIKGVFSISSIILAVAVIISSVAYMVEIPVPQNTETYDTGSEIESPVPAPAIIIDYPEITKDDGSALAQLGDDLVMVHFVEFPPMHINVLSPLNN